jgi:hypothetical protein
VIILIKLVVKIVKLILVLAAEIYHLQYVLATILCVVMEQYKLVRVVMMEI